MLFHEVSLSRLKKAKRIRGENYYLFNVEPNQNKSTSKFWRDVIHRLVYDNECLVIQQDGMFYVADSFTVSRYAFKEIFYHDIVIDDYQLNNSYLESQVFHFELHDKKIRDVIEGLYQSYAKLITASQKHYIRNNAKRGTLRNTDKLPADGEGTKRLARPSLNSRIKRFYEAEERWGSIAFIKRYEITELENR